MSEWISIKDRLPTHEESVLCLYDEGICEAMFTSEELVNEFTPIFLNYHGCGCCGGYKQHPTHWMPRPTPPVKE